MSENIQGGTYGAEIEADVASSLLVDDAPEETGEVDTPSETNGEDATVAETQSQETEQVEQAEDAPFVDELDLDGTVYTMDELRAALEDSQNKNEWQKSNTQKAQEVADARKLLDGEKQKWNSIMQDQELVDTLKDYLGEDHALFNTKEPSNDTQQDTNQVPEPVQDRLRELEERFEMQEAEAAVERDIQSLIAKHPELDGNEDALQEVLQTSVDKGITNLEDAFILTNHQASVDSALAKAVKTLEKAESQKQIPEADVKHQADRTPVNEKPKDFDEARDMAMRYDIFK